MSRKVDSRHSRKITKGRSIHWEGETFRVALVRPSQNDRARVPKTLPGAPCPDSRT
jgi:hypothetical protein